MYSLKSQSGLGFVLSYLNIFVSSLVGILFTPYMISSLGSTEYGLYQLLYATIGYVALLDFGLGSTLTRFILKYKAEGDQEKIDAVTTMCMKIYCGIGAIVLLLVWIFSFNLEVVFKGSITPENVAYAKKLFLVMGATTSVSFISHALSGVMLAYEQYAVAKGVSILRQLLRIVLIIVLIELQWNAMAIVITDFILSVIMAVFDFSYCKFVLKSKIFIHRWHGEMFRSLFSFSFFVFLQIIVTQVNNGMDRVLLGIFGTLELVALYGVAFQLYNLFNSIGGVVTGITLPQVSRAVFSNSSVDETTDCCAHYSRYQLHILAPLLGGFLILGKQFISLWTPDYDPTQVYIITLLIVVPQILESTEGTIFNVMKAKNLQATRSLILICVAVFHIILSAVLVQVMPVYGTAIGTFISFVIGNNIISNIYYQKKVGINVPRFFKKLLHGILPVFILSVILGFFIALIPLGGWIGFIVKGFLYIIVYLILILLFGINRDEKRLLQKILNKFKKIIVR